MKAKLQRTSFPVSTAAGHDPLENTQALLTELVAHLRRGRTQLREQWARRITASRLLMAMTQEEIFAEATAVYDNYVAVLETGAVEALQEYARDLSNGSSPAVWRPMKSWGSCFCCAMCWPGRCLRNINMISEC